MGTVCIDLFPVPLTLPTAGQESKQVNVDNQSKKTQRKDRENIAEAIRILFEPGQVVELRVPKAGKLGTISGYFDDHNKLAEELERLSGTAPAVYYTLNPVNPALLARANNHTNPYAKGTTNDAADNIVGRRWLLIDCDPMRPADISATEEEKEAARRIAAQIKSYLKALGWSDPVVADSGNGYHLLYRVDLPNDEESRALIESVLKALAVRFDNNAVKIDQKVFNASRITKAYGTLACKGDSIPERQHRLSRMFAPPEVIEPVAKELLAALAAETPKPEKRKSGAAATSTRGGWSEPLVEEVLDKAGVNRGDAIDYKGETKWQHDCFNNPEHRKPDAYTILDKDGYAHHHCSHNSCADLEDAHWRRLWEERTDETYPFPNRRRRANADDRNSDLDWAWSSDQHEEAAHSWSKIADELDEIRRGKEEIFDEKRNNKSVDLPRHIAEERILQFVRGILTDRGKGRLFFDAYPYVYLPEEKQVVRFQDDAEAHQLLGKLRLRIRQRDTDLVRENLRAHIMEFGEPTRVEGRVEKEMASTLRLATRENEAKLGKLQAERERDKIRYESELAKTQGKLDDLSRKLEKQTGEQLGAEAELDLFTELRHAFPDDKIERIGRGVKGADIVHHVMDGAKVAGRIVYESKNTLGWQNGFIAQAKKYQTQYETPHVMIVTRVFPSKHKGFCIVKDIPVVEKRVAIALATVIRDGVIEIAKLRLSGKFHDEKSQELFEYVIGDKFCTRFREIAEGVAVLREQQQKSRTWHENAWLAEAKIHDRLENRHREIDAQIQTIVGRATNGKAAKFAARSARLQDVAAAVH